MATKPKHKRSRLDMTSALESWPRCNDFLRNATEEEAKELLELEKANKNRRRYVLRIHARFNRQRAARERATV